MKHPHDEPHKTLPVVLPLPTHNLDGPSVSKPFEPGPDHEELEQTEFFQPFVNEPDSGIIIPRYQSAPALELHGNVIMGAIILADVFGVGNEHSLEGILNFMIGVHQLIRYNVGLSAYKTAVEKLLYAEKVLRSLGDGALKDDAEFRAAFRLPLPIAVKEIGARVRRFAKHRPEALDFIGAVEWLEEGMDVICQLRVFITGQIQAAVRLGIIVSDDTVTWSGTVNTAEVRPRRETVGCITESERRLVSRNPGFSLSANRPGFWRGQDDQPGRSATLREQVALIRQ